VSKCEVCGEPYSEHGGFNAACPPAPAHTPGPWKWSDEGAYIVATHADLGSIVIAKIAFVAAESVANGHLMTAAPELLAALKAVVSVADRKTAEFDLARSAIAKAEGRNLSSQAEVTP
jgi:hypothetical protein